MHRLDIKKMLQGDIILTSNDKLISKQVAKKTGGVFSHAMLYVGYGMAIESILSGTRLVNIRNLTFQDGSVALLRLKGCLSSEESTYIQLYAHKKLGDLYSIGQAIKAAGKFKDRRDELAYRGKQFCSRLVLMSYASAKISLLENPFFSSPNDILKSDKLYKVDEISIACENKVKIDSLNFPEEALNSLGRIIKKARDRCDLALPGTAMLYTTYSSGYFSRFFLNQYFKSRHFSKSLVKPPRLMYYNDLMSLPIEEAIDTAREFIRSFKIRSMVSILMLDEYVKYSSLYKKSELTRNIFNLHYRVIEEIFSRHGQALLFLQEKSYHDLDKFYLHKELEEVNWKCYELASAQKNETNEASETTAFLDILYNLRRSISI